MKNKFIGYEKALRITLDTISPLRSKAVPITEAVGYVATERIAARTDSPSANVSLKDGFAIRAEDIFPSKPDKPIALTVTGAVAAGQKPSRAVKQGSAQRILTGAKLPKGADTVIAEELTCWSNGYISISHPLTKGNDILLQGIDAAKGDVLVEKSTLLTPERIGLLVAGGHSKVRVLKKPAVALIATGDEVLHPGEKIAPGKQYASNLLTLHSWCRRFGFNTKLDIVGDKADRLRQRLWQAAIDHDAIVTSGGAWTGDRDLMVRILEELGWEKKYHRVRLGPGKGAGFGLLNQKPFFMLPGGPPSNLVAFLVLALPGLLKLSGLDAPGLFEIPAILDARIAGKSDWTQVKFGELHKDDKVIRFLPHRFSMSRLKSLAEARGFLLIPEGIAEISAGQVVSIRLLHQL